MGGNGSVPLPRYSCCIRAQNPNRCKENHSSTPRYKGHRRNLSAAFNMADMGKEVSQDLIDVNAATEEELMTLPGINRLTARNIVEYRKQIGGYKRVEDLALVSGVGANKLVTIRMEICVGRKKYSQNSSPNSSKLELSMQDDISRSSSKSHARQFGTNNLQNVNSSNVFQLMKVPGLSQTLAENIVAYRDKKGYFRHMDELLKVKGIKKALLSAVRPYLVLSAGGVPEVPNGIIPGSYSSHQVESNHVRQPSQTLSLPARPHSSSILGSQEDLVSLYGPIAKKSFRCKKKPVLFRKNGQNVVRLCSWNLHQCSEEKAENPGVREVIALTILENGLSVVAVQDLKSSDALVKLCDELNAPTIPNVKKWSGHLGSWQSSISSHIGGATQTYCGFLYDTSRGIEIYDVTVLDHCVNSGKELDRKPVVAKFKIQDVLVCTVNISWEPHQPDTILEDVLNTVMHYTQDVQDVVILGGFYLAPEADEFTLMRNQGYNSMLRRDDYTDITTRNPEGTRCNSNIWLSNSLTQLYTGCQGVIRDGLTSPWIPDGWGWGGVVSSQCPLWAEIYTDLSRPVAAPAVLPSSGGGGEETEDEDFVDAPEERSLTG